MNDQITAGQFEIIKKNLRKRYLITARSMQKVKDNFSPGMRVRNTISGNIGVLIADSDNPNKVDAGSPWTLAVRTTHRKGSKIGKNYDTYWTLLNVEII